MINVEKPHYTILWERNGPIFQFQIVDSNTSNNTFIFNNKFKKSVHSNVSISSLTA